MSLANRVALGSSPMQLALPLANQSFPMQLSFMILFTFPCTRSVYILLCIMGSSLSSIYLLSNLFSFFFVVFLHLYYYSLFTLYCVSIDFYFSLPVVIITVARPLSFVLYRKSRGVAVASSIYI